MLVTKHINFEKDWNIYGDCAGIRTLRLWSPNLGWIRWIQSNHCDFSSNFSPHFSPEAQSSGSIEKSHPRWQIRFHRIRFPQFVSNVFRILEDKPEEDQVCLFLWHRETGRFLLVWCGTGIFVAVFMNHGPPKISEVHLGKALDFESEKCPFI